MRFTYYSSKPYYVTAVYLGYGMVYLLIHSLISDRHFIKEFEECPQEFEPYDQSTACLADEANTWINVDLSAVKFCSIHLRAFSQEMRKMSIIKMCCEITLLRLPPYLFNLARIIQYDK